MSETSELKSPISVACPACFVPAGQKCTQPTDTSRREVSWFHFARETAAETASDPVRCPGCGESYDPSTALTLMTWTLRHEGHYEEADK